MPRLFLLLADVTLIAHACFVAFVVGGQAGILIGWWRGWVWTRLPAFRLAHASAIGVVAAKAWLGVPCVLTVLENSFRVRAGGAPYQQTFVGHWVGRFLFYDAPPWAFTLAYSFFAVLVLATWFAVPPRRPAR
jgi:hypothetical protein